VKLQFGLMDKGNTRIRHREANGNSHGAVVRFVAWLHRGGIRLRFEYAATETLNVLGRP
jgi:hypothetical protein